MDPGKATAAYGRHTCRWMARMAGHGRGIALLFARTDTEAWHDWVFPCASAVLFLAGRLRFRHVDGREGGKAAAPSALISYGKADARVLRDCGLRGRLVRL